MKNRLEKILKRGDGSRIKIIVELSVDYPCRNGANFNVTVFACLPKKRTWLPSTDLNDYFYRAMSRHEKKEARMNDLLHIVTYDEINQAQLELWNSIKPEGLIA